MHGCCPDSCPNLKKEETENGWTVYSCEKKLNGTVITYGSCGVDMCFPGTNCTYKYLNNDVV